MKPVNPYEPLTNLEPLDDPDLTEREVLASRDARFFAWLIDGLLALGVIVSIQYSSGFLDRTMAEEASLTEELVMSLVDTALILVMNGYLLVTRGQTIGKALLGIQIVDSVKMKLLPFSRVYLFRYLWIFPIELASVAIPGEMDDIFVLLIWLVDGLMIFGDDRRCLHDYIAGSVVALYRPDRPRLD